MGGGKVSLSVITSRPWHPWPKIRWGVFTLEKDDGTTMSHEDCELIWPWMRCIGIGIHKGG